VICLITSAPAGSSAQGPADDERPVVLLVTSGLDGEQAGELIAAVSAHLHDVGAEVRAVEPPALLGAEAEPLSSARTALEEHGALAAFWWNAETSSLHILTPELGDAPAVKLLTDTDGGWAARCDAMATVIESELVPLLEAAGTAAGRDQEQGDLALESITDLVKPVARPTPGGANDGGTLEVIGAVGWAPALLSTDGPFVHGAHLGVGLLLLRYVELALGLDLWTRPELPVSGRRIELVQWPVRLTATAQLPLDAWDLGLRFGAVLNTWYLRGLDYSAKDPDGAGPNLSAGVAASLVVRYRVREWIAPWIEIGTDLYAVQSRHVYDGETVIKLAYARPRACIGVAFVFGED